MKHDYKHLTGSAERPKASNPLTRYWHIHGAVLFVVCATLAVLLVESEKSVASLADSGGDSSANSAERALQARPSPEPALRTIELPLPPKRTSEAPNPDRLESIEQTDWQAYVVRPGYNFALISQRAGIEPAEVHALMSQGEKVAPLNRLYPDDVIRLKVLSGGRIGALEYDIHPAKRLRVVRTGETTAGRPEFAVETHHRPLETRHGYASATIKHSLFAAARRAGLNDKMTMELAGIFGWDIDFTQQVQRGDSFTVVYEEKFRGGEKIDDGPILAAEFNNNGERFRAIRFTDPKGRADYYTPEGKSVRKTFIRNPIDLAHARISSHFNLRRRHPILHKIRAHKGTDYAARPGTPIKVTGDGKVVHRGRKGGYGNAIVVKHGQRYSTLYAHMSRFAANTRVGRRVKQGQIIGYVGSSGLATGPHLHYEFRVNGVHRNPLTVKHPSVEPVPEQYRADFRNVAETRVAQLDTLGRTYLASN